MIDIYSRYIVGAHIHSCESGELAVEMMKEVFGIHGTPQVIMPTVARRRLPRPSRRCYLIWKSLASHSRPRVSNDNPSSEAWFKTLKFAPVFPERFGPVGEARAFMATFVDGYSHTHRHTGIGLKPQPTSTMASPPVKPSNVPRPSPQLALGTPSALPPPQTRRS